MSVRRTAARQRAAVGALITVNLVATAGLALCDPVAAAFKLAGQQPSPATNTSCSPRTLLGGPLDRAASRRYAAGRQASPCSFIVTGFVAVLSLGCPCAGWSHRSVPQRIRWCTHRSGLRCRHHRLLPQLAFKMSTLRCRRTTRPRLRQASLSAWLPSSHASYCAWLSRRAQACRRIVARHELVQVIKGYHRHGRSRPLPQLSVQSHCRRGAGVAAGVVVRVPIVAGFVLHIRSPEGVTVALGRNGFDRRRSNLAAVIALTSFNLTAAPQFCSARCWCTCPR